MGMGFKFKQESMTPDAFPVSDLSKVFGQADILWF